ncbi:MAG: hypothetical protein K2Q34_01905 [Alphaproteobacteria bacterium]|nr:hypothetical protein [Alphaproteobacteria bacterium]
MNFKYKIIAMAALFGVLSGGSIASAPSTAIDLNNPDVLMDDAKPKDVKAVLFIKPVPGTGLQAQVVFDPDLVDSLYDRPGNTRFANPQARNAISGMSYLYKRLADVAGSPHELKNRLNRFIGAGHPLGALFTLDFTDPKLALDNPANATAYQQLSNILRYENYGEPTPGDINAEQAARHAIFVANQAKKATATGGVSVGETTAKPRAVVVPAPVVAIDPTSPAVLHDDATMEQAMAVLLITPPTEYGSVMHTIAFDPSLLLGLIPEDFKTLGRPAMPNVSRFKDSRVGNLITGIKRIYFSAMESIDYNKELFKAILTQFTSEGHALVVPFKLNPGTDTLDFMNPFTGYAEENRKQDLLRESVKTRTNKFLAPGETRTLDAELAARQRVLEATRGTASVPVPMAVTVPA